jgi:hypothetical protein
MDDFAAFRRSLAHALVGGPWQELALAERAMAALGVSRRDARLLARSVLQRFPGDQRPRSAALAARLGELPTVARVWMKRRDRLKFQPGLPPMAAPISPLASCPLPEVSTPADLAAWLGETLADLEWMADLRGWLHQRSGDKLHHYRYRWLRKRRGGVRLLEIPKPRLKRVQRQLLRGLLDPLPTHPAAHGYCAGRSIRTCAQPHVGRRVVLRLDLADFFPSITRPRVLGLFRIAGYPEPAAALLAGLCTHRARREVLEATPALRNEAQQIERLYGRPHLPQGAPTSPALANLCAFRLDCRLTGLATAAGARYTRYADDLVFSGDEVFARGLRRFEIAAAAIALEEGFAVQHRKTQVMRRGVRQQVVGVVVNATTNVRRNEFDRLKATLHNCARRGPAAENRDGHAEFRAHLAGRIAHVASLDPGRGRKLWTIFARINWIGGGRHRGYPVRSEIPSVLNQRTKR